jgi:hypothetical protein
VQAEADPQAAENGEVPIRVSVIEAPRRRLELGLGFSTDTGFRGNVDWRNNDIFARDWRLRMAATVETVQQFAEIAIDLPEHPSGWADTVGVRAKYTDIENLETSEATFAVRRTAVEERSRPAFGAQFILARSEPSGFPVEDVYATFVDYTHTWRTTDNLLSPRRGWMAQGEVGGGIPGISTKGFGRVIGRFAWFVPLGMVDDLSFRAEAGAVIAPSTEGIPQSLLFRTGGATTVRGYNFESLGVEQGEAVVGGRYLAIMSGEYTRWIWLDLGGHRPRRVRRRGQRGRRYRRLPLRARVRRRRAREEPDRPVPARRRVRRGGRQGAAALLGGALVLTTCRPGLGSASIAVWMQDNRPGERWISSRMQPSGKRARNALGSRVACSRTSGSSSDVYGRSGNSARTSVVLPDWRGPVTATTGKPRARARSRGFVPRSSPAGRSTCRGSRSPPLPALQSPSRNSTCSSRRVRERYSASPRGVDHPAARPRP